MNVKFWQAGISWTKFQIFNELGLLVVLLVLLLLQTAQGNSLFSQMAVQGSGGKGLLNTTKIKGPGLYQVKRPRSM